MKKFCRGLKYLWDKHIITVTIVTMASEEAVSVTHVEGVKEEKVVDPILTPSDNRYVLFPIKHKEIWDMYHRMIKTVWFPEEIKLSGDRDDWEHKLNDNERFFIKNILAFFACSDSIVMENLTSRFSVEIQIPEVQGVYAYQNFIEFVHSNTYSLLIETYIKDEAEKNKLFRAIDEIPAVKKKAEWALKWIADKDSTLPTRLVAFLCVEGIYFSSSFCAIFWLKKRGLMPGLTFSNELISRDEGDHTDFAALLYSMLLPENKLAQETVYDIFKDAVAIEKEFITDSIPCSMIGMNTDSMCQYVEFVGDRLLKQLGYDPLWGAENPFDFMELISLRNKNNFFEKRVGEYIKAKGDLEEVDDF